MQINSPPATDDKTTNWLDKPISSIIPINWETFLFAIIILVAVFTRFFILEKRVMSHDETSHVYFSWMFYKGQGYAHDPITHGPFQFHIVALSYFLFGDSDFSARIPAALFGIASIVFILNFRRYLGRPGALIAAFLFLISPYMLYYTRYVRNESFVALFGLINIWAMLRYFETGKNRYLPWLTLATVLHFITKETSYIYTAQTLLFLAIYLVYRITNQEWSKPRLRNFFFSSAIIGIFFVTTSLLLKAISFKATPTPDTQTSTIPAQLPLLMVIIGLLALLGAVYFLAVGYTIKRIRSERSFDMAVLVGTLVLPLLSAFVINLAGWKIPVSASEVKALTTLDIFHMALVVIPIFIIAIGIGLWWNPRIWLINAGLFYGIFTVFYTSLFTNGAGFFTGLVGSLGYWLAQQEVNRGSQPWFYYTLIQVPIYEYLPALTSLLAVILGLFIRNFQRKTGAFYSADIEITSVYKDHMSLHETDSAHINLENHQQESREIQTPPVFALLLFWSLTSIIAYTIAGEKMPWLTVHITLPLILLGSMAISYIIQAIDWSFLRAGRGWTILTLIPVFLLSLLSVFGSILGDNPPFQGRSLEQLSATSTFIIAVIMACACGIGLFFLLKGFTYSRTLQLFTLTFIAILALTTIHTSFQASYQHYDLATEYLVYAHSGPGDKIALAQIEDLSKRLTGGLDMVIAYDNETTYPYWWYLRNYPQQRYYDKTPTRDLREVPAILVGEANYSKLEPIVGNSFYPFEYSRIWWPNQDYFSLTLQSFWNDIRNPEMRAAWFQIWLNRDFTKYGQVTGRDMSLENWSPAQHLRLYLRKDLVAKLWDYGVAAAPEEILPEYEKSIQLSADIIYGSPGVEPGQFTTPRNVALSPDGSLYIADTNNHRIQHLDADGTFIHSWGTYADLSKGDAPGGTFYEPWGIAIGPDGTIFVADTWNHRIQRFSSDGDFISMWGFFGQAETPYALWGPRGITVDNQGRVYVTDTGNKRIVVYDMDGQAISEFGSAGFEPGQFNEPVGIVIDSTGNLYIADTWNQRVQVMAPDGAGDYTPLRSWEIIAWYGQSLDNKPYITVDQRGHVYISDPEGNRIIEFTNDGQFVQYWGDYGTTPDRFNLPTGITLDQEGGLWVSDAGNNRVMHFILPQE